MKIFFLLPRIEESKRLSH